MRNFLPLILLISFFGLAACDTSSDGTLKEVPPPLSHAAWVTAAEGGSVTLDDGARVEIPAGALTTDATVILERVTCDGYLRHPDFGGCLYAVRAEGGAQEGGLALTGRYTLTLPGHAGESAAAGTEADGACVLGDGAEGWRCQGDSATADGGRVTATASRFGQFLHRLPLLGGALSPTLVWDLPFSVCDGDLLGEWELEFIVAPFDALGVGSWSGGEDFSDCAPHHYHKARTTEYHERLVIGPPWEEGQAACMEIFRSYTVYEFSYFTQACLDLHDHGCPPPCAKVAGVCGCAINKASGEGGGGDCLLENPDGSVSFEGNPNPVHHCVLGDALTVAYEDPAGPVLKVYRRK